MHTPGHVLLNLALLGNIVGHVKGVTKLADLTAWANEQFDPKLDWDKVARIRDQWGGKFILKGILDAEDAKMAADAGLVPGELAETVRDGDLGRRPDRHRGAGAGRRTRCEEPGAAQPAGAQGFRGRLGLIETTARTVSLVA